MPQLHPSKHTATNKTQAMLLLAAMCCLLAFIGYILGGLTGAVWAILLAGGFFLLVPRVSPSMIMRIYRARVIRVEEAQAVYSMLHDMAQQGGLSTVPVLYYVPTRVMNAFAVGDRRRSGIAVTDGLLNSLSFRELAGVLAHEVSHIINDDVRVMTLADIVSRVTAVFSTVGKILLFINLPLLLTGQAVVSWWLVLVLVFAPTVSMLLQLALSRSREFDADYAAVQLTRDPLGLASALRKIEYMRGSIWDRLLFPGRKEQEPSFLRTHPVTEERVKRLLEIADAYEAQEPRYTLREGTLHSGFRRRRIVAPRWHLGGFWQ